MTPLLSCSPSCCSLARCQPQVGERQQEPKHRGEGPVLCTLKTKGQQELPHERKHDPSPTSIQKLEHTLQSQCLKLGTVGQGGSLGERREGEDKAREGSNKRLTVALTRNLRKTFFIRWNFCHFYCRLGSAYKVQLPESRIDPIPWPASAAEAEKCGLWEEQI